MFFLKKPACARKMRRRSIRAESIRKIWTPWPCKSMYSSSPWALGWAFSWAYGREAREAGTTRRLCRPLCYLKRVCGCAYARSFVAFRARRALRAFSAEKHGESSPLPGPRLAAKQDITFDDKCFYFLLLEQLVATVALRAGLVPVFVKVAKLACDRCICLAAVRFLFYHQHLLTGAFYDLYPKSIQVGFVRGQLASGRGNCLRTGAGLHKDAIRLC